MRTNPMTGHHAPVPMTVRDATRMDAATAKRKLDHFSSNSLAVRAAAAGTRMIAGEDI